MGYRYDVFLSYKQDHEDWNRWVEELFLGCLRDALIAFMSDRWYPSICFDKHSFQVGNPLSQEVRGKVIKSRVLICLWSPKYFESEWCREELTIMLQRRIKHQDKIFILPVPIIDGKRFPDLIHELNLLMFDEIQK
jgi:hypothetical protein